MTQIPKPTVGRIVHVIDMRDPQRVPLAAIVTGVENADPDIWQFNGAWICITVFASSGHAVGWLTDCTPEDVMCAQLPHQDEHPVQKTRWKSLGPYVWIWPPR